MIPTTLQRYVLRETLRVALLATVALSAIIFVGAGAGLARHGVNVVQLWSLAPFLLAYSVPYAVPCALLVAVVFVFGRLSGANEITAIRSAGINLNRVIFPLLSVAVLVCCGTFCLNHYLLPWGNARKNQMAKDIVGRALTQIGTVQKVFTVDPYVIYVGRAEEGAALWQNVAVIQFADDEFPSSIMIAKQAHCAVDEDNQQIKLLLLDVMVFRPKLGGDLKSEAGRASFERMSHTIDFGRRRSSSRPKYDQLPELLVRIEVLEAAVAEIRRTFDDPAALEHPRQARDAAEKRMDAAWREVQRVDEDIETCRRALNDAKTAVREAEDVVLEAKGDVGAARQEHDDIAAKIEDREPTLEAMKEELKALIDNEAAPERIQGRREDVRKEWQAIEALRVQLETAARALETEEAELKETEAVLKAREEEAEMARAALAAAEERAASADSRYQAERARVQQVKDVESLLRAKTAFHWRNASALTTLIFVMIGIPLGILSRRGSVLMAFVVSFFAVLVLYYPLMMIAQLVSLDGYVTPWVAQWMPSAVVGGIGLWLLGRGDSEIAVRKLDRYIAWNFIAPFAIATAFITGLYIVGDAFGKLDDYIEEADAIGAALARMAQMYALRIPAFVAPIVPIGMLFGAAYGISQLSGRNELTAMNACGISLWRILAPIYVVAAIIALLGMANRELLVPKVEAEAAGDLARYTGEANKYRRVTLCLEREETWFTMQYNVERRHARSVSITRPATREHIRALEARPVAAGWELTDATVGDQTFPQFTLKTALRHRDVERALVDPSVCPISDLRDLIESDPDNRAYRMLYHARLTYPFVGIVLVGLGLPFVIGHERIRRSRLLGVGVCVVICMIFYTVNFVAHNLGKTGYLPPALAAWLPTVVFGALGFYFLDTLHS